MPIKPLSFKANEVNLLEYAENQAGGFSYYIKELIRKDMQGGNVPPVSNIDIETLLKIMANQNKDTTTNQHIEESTVTQTANELSATVEEDVPTINLNAVNGILGGLSKETD